MMQLNNLSKHRLTFGLWLLALFLQPAFAEEIDTNIQANNQNIVISVDARWYQVNVLVFSQNTVIERDPEMWPSYPTIDRSVPPISLLDPPLPAMPDAVTDDLPLDAMADIDTPVYGLDETPVDAAILEVDSGLRPPWVAFEKLPESQRYLNPYAERIARDRRFKILFHESWIQPIEAKSIARPISITGGHHSGLLDELSGLLKITISRYLHLDTQLYLTDIVESSDPFDLLTGQKYEFVPLLFPNVLLEAASDSTAQSIPTIEVLEPINLAAFYSLNDDTEKPDYFNIPATYAVAVNSVLMQETRRMRSKELHYIDNPKMGLLIYFTPFDISEEPEDSMADEVDPMIEVNAIDTLQ